MSLTLRLAPLCCRNRQEIVYNWVTGETSQVGLSPAHPTQEPRQCHHAMFPHFHQDKNTSGTRRLHDTQETVPSFPRTTRSVLNGSGQVRGVKGPPEPRQWYCVAAQNVPELKRLLRRKLLSSFDSSELGGARYQTHQKQTAAQTERVRFNTR